jgi:hypothetical protein
MAKTATERKLVAFARAARIIERRLSAEADKSPQSADKERAWAEAEQEAQLAEDALAREVRHREAQEARANGQSVIRA